MTARAIVLPCLTRQCPDCGEWRDPDSGFHRGQWRCRRCNYAAVKRWRQENPEKARAQWRRGKRRRTQRRRLARQEGEE